MAVRRLFLAWWLLSPLVVSPRAALPSELAGPIQVLRAVAAEGQGNAAATTAWQRVAAADVRAVPDLLGAMDGANDYALNWVRSAVEAMVQRGTTAGRPLPVAELEGFLRETKHHPRARRMAYELIRQADPGLARRLLPGFVNDPDNELRRDAVQLLADAAAKTAPTDKAAAIAGFRQALGYAREAEQIDDLAKKLGDLGEKVDLRKVFGWVTQWKLIGPFDNTKGAGFAKAFPPEEKIDLAAELDGKIGKVRWVDFVAKGDYGQVDFNQPFTSLKEVTGYAYSEFWSDAERPVQIRLGCDNGWKVWLNGKFLFGRDEYHRNVEIDQYRLAAVLKPGKNTLLVKCTQNEQVEDWTKTWEFALRVTDEQGTPIVSSK
jgi:hypothetical protein